MCIGNYVTFFYYSLVRRGAEIIDAMHHGKKNGPRTTSLAVFDTENGLNNNKKLTFRFIMMDYYYEDSKKTLKFQET